MKPATRRGAARRVARGDWLTLGAASRALGVDEDTLRRWADSGKVDVFVTPGGHRRFPRAAIEAMIPAPPRATRPRSLSGMGAPIDRVAARLRRRVRSELTASGPWAERLGEEDRAVFREHGRVASAVVLHYLDTTRRAERERLMAHVEEIGRGYGGAARQHGLSLGDAAQAFLFFRSQFIAELASVARRRGLTADRAAQLFEEADRALDRMLLALIEAHQRAQP
jgi:excisionase family DNA binding protein